MPQGNMLVIKKALWALAAIAILAYLANNYFENRAKEDAERAAALAKVNATKAAVARMVARTNAVTDWDKKLSKGERIRFSTILSVELEKLWIGNRPILFGGAIDDISTINAKTYRVIFSRSIFSSLQKHGFDTDLLLDLQCDRSMIDSILNSNPELFENSGWNNGVAVVAKITKIETDQKIGEGGEKTALRIGSGSCVDIVYTGRVAI